MLSPARSRKLCSSFASSFTALNISQRLFGSTRRLQQHPGGQAPAGGASPLQPITPPSSSPPTDHGNNASSGNNGFLAIHYTSGSGKGANGLAAPTTALTAHCDTLAESLSKADELLQQKKAQEVLGAGAEVLTTEAIDEMIEELQEMAVTQTETMVDDLRRSPALIQQAGMHELRRTLYYATSLQSRDWIAPAVYTAAMRMLTAEVLRRDSEGVLAPDDVLFITTHVTVANFYNRHLWNRMEKTLQNFTLFESVDLPTIKALTTKLFKTRRGCARETLDVRRKLLAAMASRVSVFANDFDLPSLLGILQCYTVHDMSPFILEPLAIRATNHVRDYTPQECATLTHVLRKFRLMRFEVCERLIVQISSADEMNHHMIHAALIAVRTCWNKVSQGGRQALHAEPTKQKLRAMGEQVGARLDEAQFPSMQIILNILDIIVNVKIYVPKKALQSIFAQADEMLVVVLAPENDMVDPKTGKRVRPVTMEEGRQLQALLLHYGADLSPTLSDRLRTAFREGLLPDEASL